MNSTTLSELVSVYESIMTPWILYASICDNKKWLPYMKQGLKQGFTPKTLPNGDRGTATANKVFQGILVQKTPYFGGSGYDMVVKFKKNINEIFLDWDDCTTENGFSVFGIPSPIQAQEASIVKTYFDGNKELPFSILKSDYTKIKTLFGAYVHNIRPQEIIDIFEIKGPVMNYNPSPQECIITSLRTNSRVNNW